MDFLVQKYTNIWKSPISVQYDIEKISAIKLNIAIVCKSPKTVCKSQNIPHFVVYVSTGFDQI